MTIRKKIMLECKNYKTNFESIDDLIGKENDYNEAKNGGYDFVGCPQSFECLHDVEELCGTENKTGINIVDECRQCWKNALCE